MSRGVDMLNDAMMKVSIHVDAADLKKNVENVLF